MRPFQRYEPNRLKERKDVVAGSRGVDSRFPPTLARLSRGAADVLKEGGEIGSDDGMLGPSSRASLATKEGVVEIEDEKRRKMVFDRARRDGKRGQESGGEVLLCWRWRSSCCTRSLLATCKGDRAGGRVGRGLRGRIAGLCLAPSC